MNTEAFLIAFISALFIGAVTFGIYLAVDQHTKLNTACIAQHGTFTQGMCIYGSPAQ